MVRTTSYKSFLHICRCAGTMLPSRVERIPALLNTTSFFLHVQEYSLPCILFLPAHLHFAGIFPTHFLHVQEACFRHIKKVWAIFLFRGGTTWKIILLFMRTCYTTCKGKERGKKGKENVYTKERTTNYSTYNTYNAW